jgi:UDP-hydrolysing UDP-N-acetyl-D-glucosamine 2-epimerase
VTGSIDESVRHAITKLSHIHFVTNADAERRVLAMGEDPGYVFNTGSLDVELAARVTTQLTSGQVNAYGVGHNVDISQPFLLVIQHPVTTEPANREHLEITLKAVAALNLPTIWFWPNPDAGTAEMSEMLRHVREQHPEMTDRMRFITNIPADEFVSLLRSAACVVGNSSAAIKECSYLGTPVVNIGGRQQGRLTADHVRHVAYDGDAIRAAVVAQLSHGRYPSSTIYYRPDTSDQILNVLATADLYTQKRFFEATPSAVKA